MHFYVCLQHVEIGDYADWNNTSKKGYQKEKRTTVTGKYQLLWTNEAVITRVVSTFCPFTASKVLETYLFMSALKVDGSINVVYEPGSM